jgi:hypothetical protein
LLPQAVQVAESLPQGEQVRQRLARVMGGRQRVDHGHRRALRQLDDVLVRARTDRDPVHVARQDASRVADRLAADELQLVPAQHERGSAELGESDLERDPGPGRGLLEYEGDGPAVQRLRSLAAGPPRLQLHRAVEQRRQLVAGQLLTGDEVVRGRHRSRRYYAACRFAP